MKLTRKILKFAEPLTYRRGWRRAQRSIFRVPLGPMLAQIDRERAREIQQRYANSTAGYAKYANIEPLPDLGQKFDWITAFSVNFNLYHPSKERWGISEWDFFLRDLRDHLAPDGKVFFGLNPAYNGDYYTPELGDLFIRRSASVERERIFFKNG